VVGIVIVSHSRKAAEGVCELALQMAGENKKILACGGMEDGGIGTDAIRIMETIREADEGEGVVVLCDLGSGILSTQTAIDLLEEPIDVRIADAPILEGAVSAAIPASFGASIEEVIAAAESAKNMKKLN